MYKWTSIAPKSFMPPWVNCVSINVFNNFRMSRVSKCERCEELFDMTWRVKTSLKPGRVINFYLCTQCKTDLQINMHKAQIMTIHLYHKFAQELDIDIAKLIILRLFDKIESTLFCKITQ